MIDLHTHTDQSDGTTLPADLIAQAQAIGLEALAITDHDTLAGHDLAAPVARAAGLDLLCGIELSTRVEQPGATKRPPSVHLLGYFPKAAPSAGFREWLLTQQESRRNRNRALIAKLNSLGVEITLEEVQKLGKHLTGRPHFAKVLLAKGYVKTNQEAFDVYLADNAKASVERDEPTLQEGVRRLAEGNGLPVLAHPIRLPQAAADDTLEALLRELMREGLGGLECYHSEHTPEATARYLRVGGKLKLKVTGGSDYHGANKPDIELGTGRGNLALPKSVLDALRAEG